MSIIVKLEAQNVKRLKAVSITPSAGCNVIGGKNAQGKTSLLDTIEMALSGKKSIPDMPIRNGEKNARIVLETEDLIVTRTFTASGSNLTVTNREGLKHTKAQGVLDDLIGRLTLDPLAFTRLDAKQQAKTLRDLIGVDTTELDAERESKFAARTEQNRVVKGLKARLDGLNKHEGVPDEEVSMSDLLAQHEQAMEINNRIAETKFDLDSNGAQIAHQTQAVDSARIALDQAEQKLKSLEKARIKIRETLEQRGSPIDTAEINAKIEKIEITNSKVRENKQRASLEKEWSEAVHASESLTAQLETIDDEKLAMLSSVEYPIEGIGIDDDGGMTYNGVPFSQASAAEQLRVSAAMGLALNPKLRVLLIRDGSLLDSDSMAELEQFATDNEAQVWIERVGDGDAGAIIIEDGEVVESLATM